MPQKPHHAIVNEVRKLLNGLIDAPEIVLEKSDSLELEFPVQFVLGPRKKVSIDGAASYSKLSEQAEGALPARQVALNDLKAGLDFRLLERFMCDPDLGLEDSDSLHTDTQTVACRTCNGQRQTNCKTCGGDRYRTCSRCGGSGRKEETCMSCGGAGFHGRSTGRAALQNPMHNNMNQSTCGPCGGRGTTMVSCGCSGGRVTCSGCSGKGKVTCSGCNGMGTVKRVTKTSAVIKATSVAPGQVSGGPGQPNPWSGAEDPKAVTMALLADPDFRKQNFPFGHKLEAPPLNFNGIPNKVRLGAGRLRPDSIRVSEQGSDLRVSAEACLELLRQVIQVEGYQVTTHVVAGGKTVWTHLPDFMGPLFAASDSRIDVRHLAKAPIGVKLKPIWKSKLERKSRSGKGRADFKGALREVAAHRDVPVTFEQIEPVYRRLEAHWNARRRRRNAVLGAVAGAAGCVGVVWIMNAGGAHKVLDDLMWTIGVGREGFYPDDPRPEMKTTASLNLRAAPDAASQIVNVIGKGDTVIVLNKSGGDWYFVTSNNQNGWVHKDYLCCEEVGAASD